MARLLFGLETEYAFARTGDDASESSRELLVAALMRAARRQLVHLPDASGHEGLFLQNASRFYLDSGFHPEIATAECADPWTAVQHLEAGHRIMAGLVTVLSAQYPDTEIACFRSNVDLSGAETTWACHESYSHRRPLGELQAQLLPHLVTRIIYTGAGGFSPFARGLEFSLSPRMAFFESSSSADSTRRRGIWHERSEPLCTGQGRLHITCGESLSSQKANFLKIGATALVIAMADAGLNPGEAVQIRDPVPALHQIAADVTCKNTVALVSGDPRSAVDIQRHYLAMAERHIHRRCMPPWAPDVCRVWREVLDAMEGAPQSLAGILDWGIKYALYSAHARKLGIPWQALSIVNSAIDQLQCPPRNRRPAPVRIGAPKAIQKSSPKKRRTTAERFLAAHRLDPKLIDALLEARPQFFELETRFTQIGGAKGVFAALDAAGALSHRIDGIGSADDATREPPSGSRAHLRGQVVRRLAGTRAQATWDRIVDLKKFRMLDLSDPFAAEEVWRPIEPQEPEPRSWTLRSQREEALSLYLSGDYAGAEELLRACLSGHFELRSTHCHLARVLLMAGREAEARHAIQLAWQVAEPSLLYVLARMVFFECLFALLDNNDVSAHLSRLRGLLGRHAHMEWTIQPMLDHLRPRLGDENHVFLSALAAAISNQARLEQLDAFPRWLEAQPDPVWFRGNEENVVAAPLDLIDPDESGDITSDDIPF